MTLNTATISTPGYFLPTQSLPYIPNRVKRVQGLTTRRIYTRCLISGLIGWDDESGIHFTTRTLFEKEPAGVKEYGPVNGDPRTEAKKVADEKYEKAKEFFRALIVVAGNDWDSDFRNNPGGQHILTLINRALED